MSKFNFKLEDSNKDNRGLIVLSNDIVKTRFKLSTPTQRLIFFLISELSYEERKHSTFIKEHSYSLNQIFDFLRESGSQNSKDLKGKIKSIIKELQENSIYISSIDDYGKEYFKAFSWYSTVEFDENRDSFKFQFNNALAPLLLNLKNNFFKSNLKEFIYLRSSHAINLYLLLRAEEYNNSTRKYPLEILKEKLNIDESKYQDYRVFRRDLLLPVLNQLNKNTNYIFSFDIQRVGRKVGFVIFQVFEKKNVKELSTYISSKLKDYFSKQDNHIKALFESRELEQILYYYDPMEDHLILSLENTPLTEDKDIKALETILEEIRANKKVFETIFRKGTTIELKKTFAPWNNLQGEDKIVFDTLSKKYGLSSKQAHAIIMKHDSKDIQTKIRENIVGHQKGFLKKYEFDKNIIKPIENIQGYIYAGLFEMKSSKGKKK